MGVIAPKTDAVAYRNVGLNLKRQTRMESAFTRKG